MSWKIPPNKPFSINKENALLNNDALQKKDGLISDGSDLEEYSLIEKGLVSKLFELTRVIKSYELACHVHSSELDQCRTKAAVHEKEIMDLSKINRKLLRFSLEKMSLLIDSYSRKFTYAFSFVNMALVSAIAIFFSTMVRNAIGPVIGTMALIIFFLMISTLPLDVFSHVQPYMFTTYFSNWEQVFYDPIPWDELFRGLSLIISNLILFLGTAFIIFRRKDILS